MRNQHKSASLFKMIGIMCFIMLGFTSCISSILEALNLLPPAGLSEGSPESPVILNSGVQHSGSVGYQGPAMTSYYAFDTGSFSVARFEVLDILTGADLDYYLYDTAPSNIFVSPIAKDESFTNTGPCFTGLSSGKRYWLAVKNERHSEVSVSYKIRFVLETP